ncbi:MAG TPA: RDD family protein [Solirubrobacteraceae bacterium]|nr:RDD family protein [Solirubrobacteraceae bacterium]
MAEEVSLPVGASQFTSIPQVRSGQPAAEAAVAGRISAAILDSLVLTAVYGVICAVLHWQFFALSHQLVALGLNIAYYFVLESRDGQTIGKRANGVCVVALDGSPPSPKAIAIRSVLRVIDYLPLWYASGLINMVRTGPERRQRIGDFAAETKVIAVEGRSLTRGTAGWVLPTVTLLAFLVSVLYIVAIVNAGNQPLTPAQGLAFIQGCERTSNGVINCDCLLDRLQADGYNTLNSLNGLMQQVRSEEFANQTGSARTEVTNAALACRQSITPPPQVPPGGG